MPLLDARNLSVTFRGAVRPVVDSVSLSVNEGVTLGIIGESGAGKSTLGLALAGLLQDSGALISGEVRFDGIDLLRASETELCAVHAGRIGYIFQDAVAALDPAVRIEDQVAESLGEAQGLSRREARLRARRELEKVGIGGELLRRAPYAHQLSGGMCQRAMIAAALAAGPRLLIADEPTSSLDVILQARIARLIKQRQREAALAMIFISHDLSLLARLVDFIAVMHGGCLVEQGACRQVLSNPAHEYTRGLVGCWRQDAEEGVAFAPA